MSDIQSKQTELIGQTIVMNENLSADLLKEIHISLTKYALYLLGNSVNATKDDGHTIVPNICVSPSVSAKAWAFLSYMASGKTRGELQKAVNQMLNQSSFEDSDGILRRLDSFGGLVRFFAEYPKELSPKEDPDHSTIYPNCKMIRLVFKVDHVGSRSIHHINSEVSNSTSNRIRYVVREENAPHWRTVTLMVSAVESSFYWKHTASAATHYMQFKNGNLISKVECWVIDDVFNFFTAGNGEKILELESYDDSSLIIIQFLEHDRGLNFETLNEYMERVESKRADNKKKISLMMPHITSATPICERKIAGQYNTKRVFDREKSELSGFLNNTGTKVSSIRTLWDHYHKVVFQIVDGKESDKAEPAANQYQSTPLKDFIGVDQERRKIKESEYKNVTKSIGKIYYEEYVNSQSCGSKAETTAAKDHSINFDSPFYFVHVKKYRGTPFVHSVGRFANGDVDNRNHQEV